MVLPYCAIRDALQIHWAPKQCLFVMGEARLLGKQVPVIEAALGRAGLWEQSHPGC